MDISTTDLTGPTLEAQFCPIYWEPLTGGNERVTALIAIVPILGSSAYFSPAAHSILSPQKLRAMLGAVRGASAQGILREVSSFMTQQLAVGLALEELASPFTGFDVGGPRIVRGFSPQQLMTAAVQMVSALGSAEEFADEIAPIESHVTTTTTREFLKLVRYGFAGDNPDLKARFHHRHSAPGAPDITLDYQHRQWLVQFASLPSNAYQSTNMHREAESKMFEIITAQKTIQSSTKPLLIINGQALTMEHPDSRLLASVTHDKFRALASMHNVATCMVGDDAAAVRELAKLEA